MSKGRSEYEPFASADTPLSARFSEQESSCARFAASARPLFLLFIPLFMILLLTVGSVIAWFKNEVTYSLRPLVPADVTVTSWFHLGRNIIQTRVNYDSGQVDESTQTYWYNDPQVKDQLDGLDIVITVSATAIATVYTSIALAVCTFVALLFAHARSADVHSASDFFKTLISRDAFREDDSWIGFPRLPLIFLALATFFCTFSWAEYLGGMGRWLGRAPSPDFNVTNQGEFQWGNGLALVLATSILTAVGSLVLAPPMTLLRSCGFKRAAYSQL